MTDPTSTPRASPRRHATKAQTAEFFDVTPSAVDGWIRRGCPVVKHGSQTSAYVLDLREVAAWRFLRDHTPVVDPESMSPAERKAWYVGESLRRRLAEDAAELIPADEVAAAVAHATAVIEGHLHGIADRLDGFPPAVIEGVREAIARETEAMRERLVPLAGSFPSPGGAIGSDRTVAPVQGLPEKSA